MTTTLFFLQNVDRSLEFLERLNLTRMAENHTALDFVLIYTTEEQTYVITSFTFIKNLAEHFNTCYHTLLIFAKTEKFYFVTDLNTTSLDTSGSNSSTTSDREHVLNRHKERFVEVARRLLNPLINSVHELHNLLFPFCYAIKCAECRTTNYRSIILEFILIKDFSNLHLNEFEHFLILNHIALVQEHNHTRNVYLTSEKHVLTCLRHRTVSCSNNKNRTVHLSSTCYHVLYIVSVSRAVNVCIVTFCCFIFYVGSIDSDTAFLLFRCVINLVKRLNLRKTLLSQNCSDGSGQSGLTMVNVTYRTNVYVRFRAHKILFSHSFSFILFI